MKFMVRRYRHKRPIAARMDCVLDGVSYKAFEYIDPRAHRLRTLKRAYINKEIGHPREGFGKPMEFMLDVPHIASILGDDPVENQVDYSDDEIVQLVHKGGPWYDVVRDGVVMNEKNMKRTEAEEFMASLLEA